MPLAGKYSTVVKFEALAHLWPEVAWNVVLTITGPPDESGRMIVEIRMQAGPNAPQGLLDPGSRFELSEGRLVATGEVVTAA